MMPRAFHNSTGTGSLADFSCMAVANTVDQQDLCYDHRAVHVVLLFHKMTVSASSHCTDVDIQRLLLLCRLQPALTAAIVFQKV